MRRKTKEKLTRGYHNFTMIVANTGLLFLLLNLLLFIPAKMRDKEVKTSQAQAHTDRIRSRSGQPILTKKRNGHQMKWTDLRSYEGVDPKHVGQVLDDFYDLGSKGYAFQPYTHFSEPTFSSPSLNVRNDESGISYRVINRKLRSKYPIRVFAFGGSTTFGWHVGDNESIPHYLEKALQQKLRRRGIWKRVEVVNYGKGYHSWFQEMVLFERLLHSGKRPHMIVFLDGVNVLHAQSPHEVPYWTDKFTELWDQAQLTTVNLPGMFPIFRVVNYFRRRHFNHWVQDFKNDRHPRRRTYALPDWVNKSKESYFTTLKQIDALASVHKIKSYYFWQPNRAYDCQSAKYSQPLPEHYLNKIVPLYTKMKTAKRPRFKFLGDLCRRFGFDKRFIVDDVHYAPAFNEFIAKKMASYIPIR